MKCIEQLWVEYGDVSYPSGWYFRLKDGRVHGPFKALKDASDLLHQDEPPPDKIAIDPYASLTRVLR